MANIVWTDAAAVDGTTTWSGAREQRLRDDITTAVNGSIEAANIADGAVTRAKLAAGNQDVVQMASWALADFVSGANAGIQRTSASAEEHFLARWRSGGATGTLIAWEVACQEVATNGMDFRPVIAGTAVGTVQTAAVSTSAALVGQTGLSIAVADGDRLGINVQGNGGTSDAYGVRVTFYIERALT